MIVTSANAWMGVVSEVGVRTLKDPSPAYLDGGQRLVYELVIENRGKDALRVKHLAADASAFGSGEAGAAEIASRMLLLSTIDFDAYDDWAKIPRAPRTEPGIVPARRSALIYLEASAALDAIVSGQIHHHIIVESLAPAAAEIDLFHSVNTAPPETLVLASPFDGGLWFPFNGPADGSAHRRSVLHLHGKDYIAQRFAVDWMMIGESGRIARSHVSPAENRAYYSYGIPIYAVADGTITSVTDDLEENIPDTDIPGRRGSIVNLQTVAGNAVILNLGKNRHAVYAHLQPGSIPVRAGEKVLRGQLIGLLGNSGNSTCPHLHFHVCDGPSALECQGVPYVFESFTHQEVTLEGAGISSLQFKPVGQTQTSRGELTRNLEQIRFPELSGSARD